jgi:lipopolysaccharide/colanic/teichoic acid biosynthesis glycosyltransferase
MRYVRLKAVLEFMAALVLLIVFAPVILLAALVVTATSRGPAFYCQVRAGRNGRLFKLYKLRSMVDRAELSTGATWCRVNDPRITPVGRVLRDTHLDELPQLVNVLLGHMSLVGPRPERPELASRLEARLPRFHERLAVRPGITGFAQLRLPPDTDLESVRRKLAYDLYYVRNVNLWLDARILVLTLQVFVKAIAGAVVGLVALPSREMIESLVIPMTNGDSSVRFEADATRAYRTDRQSQITLQESHSA